MQLQKFGSVARDSRLFGAVVAGWSAYDLCLVAVSGEAYLAAKLLPGYVAALLVAAVVGILFAFDRRIFWTCFTLAVIAGIAPKFYRPDVAWHLICLPRADRRSAVATASSANRPNLILIVLDTVSRGTADTEPNQTGLVADKPTIGSSAVSGVGYF